YQELGQFEKALEYHYKALDFRLTDPALAMHVPISYNNIGICLENLGRLDEAEKEYRKGIKWSIETENKRQYFDLISNLADILVDKFEYDEAKALCMEILQNESNMTMTPKLQLSAHAVVAQIYLLQKRPQNALHHVKEGLQLVERHPDI